MTKSARFFCSELSRASGETTAGTASVGAVWFLLEYPHGWGTHALRDSALSPELKHFFNEATAKIKHSRLLFIKTDRGRRDERMNFFVVRCREREPFVVRHRLKSYDDVMALDLSRVATGEDLQGGAVTGEPLFLVCTHGRRDKCCAKFGIPAYNSLRDFAGYHVWQSSHVGGDRFAANIICFPHGLFYAHASADAGRRIAEEYLAGRVAREGFRGRACYTHFVQAAESFVREEAGVEGVEDLRFVSSKRVGGSEWSVRFAEAGASRLHEARVLSRMSEFKNFITCHSEEPSSVRQFLPDGYNSFEEN